MISVEPSGGLAGRLTRLVIFLLATSPLFGGAYGYRDADWPRVIPDTTGEIAEIVLHYLPDMEQELRPMYRDLFRSLPGGIVIRVVCPSEEAVEEFERRWERRAASQGRVVQVISADREITIWARDRRIPRHRSRTSRPATHFVPVDSDAYEEDKRNELLMVSDLAAAGFMTSQMVSRLWLEGGNVVSNERHAFVGGNVMDDNLEVVWEGHRLERELTRVLGLETVLVHDAEGNVPFVHVDMYLTPIRDDRVLVANVTDGMALLFDCELEAGEGPALDRLVEQLDDSAVTAERFDAVAEQLNDWGYHVQRLPALVDRNEDWMVTYNNVVVDARPDGGTVYMPVYRLPSLDDAAEAAYRSLGFEVCRIDVSGIYDLGGAVRCVMNVTRRFPAHVKRPNRARLSHAPIRSGPDSSTPGRELIRTARHDPKAGFATTVTSHTTKAETHLP